MTKKKKILAISPIMPDEKDLERFSKCLGFLEDDFDITWLDGLRYSLDMSHEEYTNCWKEHIESLVDEYHAFIGFSFGAVILQHCLSCFQSNTNKVVLLSPPSIMSDDLQEKLSSTISKVNSSDPKQALVFLNSLIVKTGTTEIDVTYDWPLVAARLTFGMGYVVENSFSEDVLSSKTKFLQIIGADSKLVRRHNLFEPTNSTLEIVANAGMRVIVDNPNHSQQIIKNWLL